MIDYRKKKKNCMMLILISGLASIAFWSAFLLGVFSKLSSVLPYQVVAILLLIGLFVLPLTFIFSAYHYSNILIDEKARENLEYNFDLQLELESYKRVGKNEHNKDNMRTYSEWSKHIRDTCKNLKTTNDFCRFLIRKLRSCKITLEGLTLIVLPSDIAVLTFFSSIDTDDFYGTIWVKLFVIVASLFVLNFCITCTYVGKKIEVDFLTDVIEVLFPEEYKNYRNL
jgi:hypothetical protein